MTLSVQMANFKMDGISGAVKVKPDMSEVEALVKELEEENDKEIREHVNNEMKSRGF